MADDLVDLYIDCRRCGAGLEVKPDDHGRAVAYDGEEVTCCVCQTVHQMGVDDNGNGPYADEDEEIGGSLYVVAWTCVHGVDGEIPCAKCDEEPAP